MSKPSVSLIVAMTADRVIGRDNAMPWHIGEDLKLFKAITTGNTLIMGRKTFESLGKPLPNRTNIVISTTLASQDGAIVAASLIDALTVAESFNRQIFFIGGATIYKQALDVVEYMHISWVKKEHTGDTFFPKFNIEEWQVLEMQEYTEFTYILYKRIGA